MNSFNFLGHGIRYAMVCALATVGCNIFSESDLCPAETVGPAIVAEVRDSVTEVAIAGNATGEIVSGDYVEAMKQVPGDPLFLFADGAPASEPLRIYEVTIEASGYEVWRHGEVPVTVDECGLVTTEIDVRMVPVEG